MLTWHIKLYGGFTKSELYTFKKSYSTSIIACGEKAGVQVWRREKKKKKIKQIQNIMISNACVL